MYITVNSIKRNLGFKGLEINDIFIAFIFSVSFLILFCLTKYKLIALSILVTGAFALIPVKVSQKNRMYKVLSLVLKYILSKKEFIYFSTNLKGMILFGKNN